MTKRFMVAVVFLVGCAVGGASSQLAVPKASAQHAAALTKWQYTCQTSGPSATASANQLGAEGWEMVAIRSGSNKMQFGSLDDIYCFKRPKM